MTTPRKPPTLSVVTELRTHPLAALKEAARALRDYYRDWTRVAGIPGAASSREPEMLRLHRELLRAERAHYEATGTLTVVWTPFRDGRTCPRKIAPLPSLWSSRADDEALAKSRTLRVLDAFAIEDKAALIKHLKQRRSRALSATIRERKKEARQCPSISSPSPPSPRARPKAKASPPSPVTK